MTLWRVVSKSFVGILILGLLACANDSGPTKAGPVDPGVRGGPPVRRREGRITATLMQPFLLEVQADLDIEQSYLTKIAAQVVATTLEGLIRKCPEPWLLLSTLTFECPEMVPPALQR